MNTSELRKAWKAFECAEGAMITIDFGPDRIRVAPPTADAWRALAQVLNAHGYNIRTADTDSYNCRAITGGSGKSLHSYGIALDVNWTTNPYKDHEGSRPVRFSNEPTQAERALDVKHDFADTDMTLAMIEDVRRIKTNAGEPVFEWGGDWRTLKDAMHFQIDLTPEQIEAGIDWDTVATAKADRETQRDTSSAPSTPAMRYTVAARSGLRLRSGPGTSFDVLDVIPLGSPVFVQGFEEAWALVDLMGDGGLDGYMHRSFLRPA